ncbi:MAG: tRNA (guanosine(37)-N1)-methyltransferase TrmD, partial [Methanomassiliicoccales archaeon]
DYPQYTRPEVFNNMEVPKVLLSGHHEKIQKWRRKHSLIRTSRQRPDLARKIRLTAEDIELLKDSS